MQLLISGYPDQIFCSFLPHIEAMTRDFFIIVKLILYLINYAVSQVLNVNRFFEKKEQ